MEAQVKVYIVVAVETGDDGHTATSYNHSTYMAKDSAFSAARRYVDMRRAKGDDESYAYVDAQEVRP